MLLELESLPLTADVLRGASVLFGPLLRFVQDLVDPGACNGAEPFLLQQDHDLVRGEPPLVLLEDEVRSGFRLPGLLVLGCCLHGWCG